VSAETVAIRETRTGARRAQLAAVLVVVAGIGVAMALTLTSGGDGHGGAAVGTATPAPAKPSPTATAASEPQLQVRRTVHVGRRPNVARAAGDNVFVGSYRRPRVSIIDARTGKIRSYAPLVGIGTADGAVGRGSVWFAVARSHVVVRLDARTGRVLRRIPLDGNPGVLALSSDALWIGLTHNDRVSDTLLKLDPRNGKRLASVDYQYGIGSLTVSPNAVWVVSRFRSFTFRADARTGKPVHRMQVGHAPATDSAYARGYLWLTVPGDDTIYKIRVSNAEPTSISVGHFPRQLALAGNTVYVTDYNSSDVYAINARSAHPIGAPVVVPANPYSIAVARGAIWVTSQPEDQITQLVEARGN
jgi:DNA-binding beta-propeller fold protein YncE